MLRSVALISVSATAFVAAAFWFMPMSAALRLSGLAGQGVAWSQAVGRVHDGEILGVAVDAQPIGRVSLRTNWAGLVSGRAPFDVSWTGSLGDGVSGAKPRADGVLFAGLEARLRLPARRLPQTTLEIPASFLKLESGDLLLSQGGCHSGQAGAQTDALLKLGQQVGLDWPLMVGTLRCNAGDWSMHLAGEAATGTMFVVETGRRAPTRIVIDHIDPQTEQVLAFAGLKPEVGRVSIEIPFTE